MGRHRVRCTSVERRLEKFCRQEAQGDGAITGGRVDAKKRF